MKITRIDFAGENATFATVSRKTGSPFIEAEILAPQITRKRRAQADDSNSVFQLASEIQFHLDGCLGTSSMIHDYFQQIELLAN